MRAKYVVREVVRGRNRTREQKIQSNGQQAGLVFTIVFLKTNCN